MEQQASDCLKNKKYNKALEIYNSLLLAQSSRDNTVSYLLGRSECLLELGQHEAVVCDCRRAIKLLENGDSASGTRARAHLVRALFALERYEDAELATREWLPLSKSSEAPQLLEKLHLAMHGSQQKMRLQVSCPYCNVAFDDKLELRLHCQSESHQILIMSDEGRDWCWRPPPRGLTDDAYRQCKDWEEKHSCRYGSQCVEAHGAEELAEWKERYKYRHMKLQRAYEKELFGKSYTEQLLEKCMQAPNTKSIMSSKIEGVEDTCSGSLTTTVLSKSSAKEWVFTLTTSRPLRAAALLHDVHRSYFKITRIASFGADSHEFEIKNNQEWCGTSPSSTVTKYEVTVEFQTNIYGTFRQSLVCDFGAEPMLMKNLCVDVIPAEEAHKINEIRQEVTLSAERWSTNVEIVPFPSPYHDEWVRQLLEVYPYPRDLHVSHATISEKRLTANNYRARMHELLYVEEMARHEQINKFSLKAKLHLVTSYILSSSSLASSTAKYSNFGELYTFVNLGQNLSEDTLCGRLILTNCNSVLLTTDLQSPRPKVYEALIEDKGKNVVYLKLSSVAVTELNLTPNTIVAAQVQFQLNRAPYCEWHYAVDKIPDLKLIFPRTFSEPYIPWSPQKQWCDNVDNRLNLKQKEAVIAITTPSAVPLPPVLIIGPFGTGKTFTLAQAIKQLMKQEGTRVLICTHSNSAADLYIKDYLDPFVKDGHAEAKPLRIYYQKRWATTVHPIVQQYCLIEESGGVRTFQIPTLKAIEQHRIIVVTLSTSPYLSNAGVPRGYFTHILLDEAGQAIECEAIMPLSLAGPSTRLVLAGDHMQLSPELYSKFAKERQLHVSLLERLYEHYPASFPCKILLRENYRAHEAIVEFTSEVFYEQKLIASGKQPRHQLLHPLTFFTARGEDIQDVNSTAFYNVSEAYEIVERVSELQRQWPKSWGAFDEHSVGIMTPYSDQVFRIRSELRKRRLGGVSVERVLNVQGKQFRAVFLSTVRTRRTTEATGDDSDYGFLSNSKLLNTAITRAQSLVAVVGDPVALCSVGRCSKVWERFIQTCDQNGSLFGVTWPFLKNQLDGLELKKTYGLNPLAPEFVPRKYRAEPYIKFAPMPNGYVQPPELAYSPMPLPLYWGFPPQNWNSKIGQPIRVLVPPAIPVIPPPAEIPIKESTPRERDLIQFFDNVHIPVKSSDSLHDLINLLPEEMSLATVLQQPIAFHKQWFHYLLVKKGMEAAKKFEYLIMMSKKDRNQEKHNLEVAKSVEDIATTRTSPGSDGDTNWFDKPVNQINFDKPVYLRDPLHLDGFHKDDNAGLNGISLHLERRQSLPLYQRQSVFGPSDRKGD